MKTTKMRTPRSSLSLLAVTALVALSAPASAATDCTTLSNSVLITGSSAFKPILAELAKVLAAANPPLTILYKGQGSCTGVDAVLNDTPVTGTGTAVSYWDSSAEQHCDMPVAGVVADIGLSDVFASTCFPGTVIPSTIGDFAGPVQTMTFVVPKASQQESMSAEAAYFIFGFGADSGIAPWTDPGFVFQRNASSGTQQMIATAIKVPAAQWFGTSTSSSADMVTKVSSSASADKTVGILATDVADDSRSILKILPYQHFDQSCGYWPDTDATSKDKRNVRDGHYAIWGPLHIITHVSIATGDPVKAAAKDVVGYLTGTLQAPAGLDLISLEYDHHVVPQCAMRVKRDDEVGPLASFQSTRSCSCYYDKLAGGSPCKPCVTKADCTAESPACNFGYCEVQ
jgi:ABC-type phosphate transport system substrate-binding protein